ncbi:MAG: metallophosphoesterase [Proteobacteria bacterium]|nr:metallophosphoesterase [Pseudomonadota bacterium]
MKISKLLGTVLVIAALIVVASLRQSLMHMPRIRVGPLHKLVAARPALRFFALGDTGTGGPDQQRVGHAMNDRCKQMGDLDGLLLLGDNAYPTGMESVHDIQWQQKILEPYSGDCLGKVPIYAVLGNHDYKSNPSAQIEFTLLNPRWYMPNRFYSVTFGDLIKIIALDSNMVDICLNPAFCGIDFLRESLQVKDTKWTVVMAHHPLESSSDHGFNYRGGIAGMLMRSYLCDRADVYLSGHSHHLEHLKSSDCRLDMFVSGGGGGDIYQTIGGVTDSRFARSQFGFLELNVSATELLSRFIGADGQVVYETRKEPAG